MDDYRSADVANRVFKESDLVTLRRESWVSHPTIRLVESCTDRIFQLLFAHRRPDNSEGISVGRESRIINSISDDFWLTTIGGQDRQSSVETIAPIECEVEEHGDLP